MYEQHDNSKPLISFLLNISKTMELTEKSTGNTTCLVYVQHIFFGSFYIPINIW